MDNGDENIKAPKERRASFRIPLRVLKVNTDNKSGREIFFGYAKDVSVEGMQIQTSNPKEVGSKFNIAFELPDKTGKIICEAEIVWNQEYNPGAKIMPAMGIRFIELSSESKKELEDFIEKNSNN